MASGVSTFRPATTQNVAYTGTAGTISNGVGDGVTAVRILATTAAFVAFGKSPTATTSDMFVAANIPEVFHINPGEKVSAVQSASGGTLYVTELA